MNDGDELGAAMGRGTSVVNVRDVQLPRNFLECMYGFAECAIPTLSHLKIGAHVYTRDTEIPTTIGLSTHQSAYRQN
jgi:hypothetical protein